MLPTNWRRSVQERGPGEGRIAVLRPKGSPGLSEETVRTNAQSAANTYHRAYVVLCNTQGYHYQRLDTWEAETNTDICTNNTVVPPLVYPVGD